MTMPVERIRSVVQTGIFLRELSTNQQIPEGIRKEAARLLRHFPEPGLLFHAAWLDEIIHSTEPGDPRRELAIGGYPELFSSSLDG